MSFLTNFIRTLVSGDKIRCQEQVGSTYFDLDLTYITNRIIAMAIPGEGFSSVYRNHIESVAEFFKQKHAGHFMIVNLSEIPYDYELFEKGVGGGKVIEKGFPDHHNPPVEYLIEICEEMDRFLKDNPNNVVSVHCLAGRGRTGTVIACYMTYSGMFESGTEALDYFASKRSTRERGVAQPSQRRYVQYVSELVSMFGQDTLNLKSLISNYFRKRGKQILKSITMYTVPKFSKDGCCPVIEIYTAPTQFNPKQLLFSSTDRNPLRYYREEDGVIEFDIDTILSGDVYIRGYHHRDNKKPKYMFRISFHVGMMPNNGILRLTKMEIDDALKSSAFDNDFFMDLTWEKIQGSEEDELDEDIALQEEVLNENFTLDD
ncbi:hypothetical protein C9374_009810 [Naegleria lovaniensis]|uniref:Phosphatidylinositol-3,4,5-trisphosphate 3-phosphatase n=1 Tax=Naegleria lovaniensis TaxID=51637 RepID=A0AA88KPJ9_NAELO|nr:uncharacterized protein C9374_009810 [Naegleria lovaniensis]KAG2393233.1 hypothetical protein C9374_009810 [Naegleria lovaniensis]